MFVVFKSGSGHKQKTNKVCVIIQKIIINSYKIFSMHACTFLIT